MYRNLDHRNKEEVASILSVWREFKRGSEEAFAHLYDSYFHCLYIYGKKFTADKELVKDSIHDLFVNLRNYQHGLTSFDNPENNSSDPVKFYLYRSLRRILAGKLSFASDNKRIGHIPDNYHFEVEISREENLILEQSHKLRIDKLNQSLQKLPVRQKEAIYLRFYEGYSYEQLASLMELNHVTSARRLVYKALNNLRKELKVSVSVFLSWFL